MFGRRGVFCGEGCVFGSALRGEGEVFLLVCTVGKEVWLYLVPLPALCFWEHDMSSPKLQRPFPPTKWSSLPVRPATTGPLSIKAKFPYASHVNLSRQYY